MTSIHHLARSWSLRAVGDSTPLASASDLDNAPPAFGHRDRQAVPIDISTVNIEMDFDYSSMFGAIIMVMAVAFYGMVFKREKAAQ